MNYPSTSQIKEAFLAVAEAEQRLADAKKVLVNLHYASEEVNHSAFLLENLKVSVAPSDDAGEVLFLRHQNAQNALTDAFKSEPVTSLDQSIKAACGLAERAVRLLHG